MINNPDKFLEDFREIFNENNLHREQLKGIVEKLNEIFENAFDKSMDKTSELVASFILGTKDNSLISDKESYDAYIKHHLETLQYLKSRITNPVFSKSTFANMEIADFKNAFELDKKILVRLVCIDRIINDKEYSIDNLYFETAGSLINRLKQSHTDWNFLIELMDKRVRNASSHLDFYYDEHNYVFRGKDVNNRSKTISEFTITPAEFIGVIMPNAMDIIQAFIAAGILLCLEPYDEYHKQALSIIR